MTTTAYAIKVRSANAADLDGLTDLIQRAATTNAILPRTRQEISAYLETFVVAEHQGAVVACAALAAIDPSHAEIRSVAVDPIVQKLGVGLRLVRFLVDIAEQVEISRLFLVTTKPGFFARAGFNAEDLQSSSASYLQALLHRNGRSLEGKSIMTLDLDGAHFTQHTADSIEHLPAMGSSPLWLDDSPRSTTPDPVHKPSGNDPAEQQPVIRQPKPLRGLPRPLA